MFREMLQAYKAVKEGMNKRSLAHLLTSDLAKEGSRVTRFRAFEKLWADDKNDGQKHVDLLGAIVENLLDTNVFGDLRFAAERAFNLVVEKNVQAFTPFVPMFIQTLGYDNSQHGIFALETIINAEVRPVEEYLPMLTERANRGDAHSRSTHSSASNILLSMARKDIRTLVTHRPGIEKILDRKDHECLAIIEIVRLLDQCAGTMYATSPSTPKTDGKGPALRVSVPA
jgi:hypothetical protein